MKLHLPRRRIWRAAIYLGSFLLVLLAIDLILVQTRRTIHPGFETTRLLAPTLADGSIDYATAIDDMYGKGVTVENNAAVPTLKALGRQVIAPYQPMGGLTDKLGMPHLPEEGNYFVMYETYCKQHSVTPSDWTDLMSPRPWPAKFDDITTQWIKDSDQPLALLVEASHRPRFFIPLDAGNRPETLLQTLLRHVVPLRDACRALQTRAEMRLNAQDVAGFRQDMLALHRLARLLGQQPTTVERVVAANIETSACQTERAAISSGKIPTEQLKQMADELAALGDLPSMTPTIENGERLMVLDFLQDMSRVGPYRAGVMLDSCLDRPFVPASQFRFMPLSYDTSMRVMNQYYDGLLAVMQQPGYPARAAAIAQWQENWQQHAQANIVSQLFSGDWPAQFLLGGLTKALDHADIARMERQLSQIAIALAQYKSAHGAYPAALADLSPEFLHEIPNDCFNEKPLIYFRGQAGYTLYSVGPNMTDDDGKTAKPYDDISASMEMSK